MKFQGHGDALDLLRQAIIHNKPPRSKDKMILFDKDLKVGLHTPSAWKSPTTGKQYSIGAIWLFLSHRQSLSNYIDLSVQHDLEIINVADRKEILDYFEGRVSESACVDEALRSRLALQQPLEESRPSEGVSLELQVADYLLRNEKPINSRTRVLRSPNKTFEHLLGVLQSASQATVATINNRLDEIKARKKHPIIVVPEGMQQGNLSISNAEHFLKEGEYIEPRAMSDGTIRRVYFSKDLRDRSIEFEVMDCPGLLSEEEWKNVVCVFVSGSKKEFSLWPVRDPLQIFQAAKGFHMKFRNQIAEVDPNVIALDLDRNTRYTDITLQRYVWQQIEKLLFDRR